MTKNIPFTNSDRVAIVDNEDFDLANSFVWHMITCHKDTKPTHYASAYKKIGKRKYTQVLLHRLVKNAPKGTQVDHIDHDGLNCQKINLRFATNSQNQCYRGVRSDNKSGYKGVMRLKRSGKWLPKICVNGKNIYLRQCDTAIEAALAYDEAAIKYHGEFAYLNFKKK